MIKKYHVNQKKSFKKVPLLKKIFNTFKILAKCLKCAKKRFKLFNI